MCQELYQRWQSCSCWGFLGPQTCPELFRTCLGPRGEQDKKIVKWNEGMCTECWDRFVEEAREMAEAAGTVFQANKRPAMSASPSSSYFSPSYSSASPSQSMSTSLTQYTPSTQNGPSTPTSASSAKPSTAKRKRHKTTA